MVGPFLGGWSFQGPVPKPTALGKGVKQSPCESRAGLPMVSHISVVGCRRTRPREAISGVLGLAAPPLFKSSARGEEGDQSGGMYTEGLRATDGQRHLFQGVGCLSSVRRTGSNRLTPWRQGDLQPLPSHLFGASYLPESDPTSQLPGSVAHVPVLP